MHWKDQRIPHKQYQTIRKRFNGYLPHWELEEGTFFLTWRLHDALPITARRELELEGLELRQRLLQADLDPDEKKQILERFELRYEDWLDRGLGACWLRRDDIAAIALETLRFHDRKLYRLVAWVIMPNHVHVVLRLLGTATLDRVMHSLKSFTASTSNKVLGRKGTFWQRDYYDRIIRSDRDLLRRVDYIRMNPVKAGLEDWEWVGADEEEMELCRMVMGVVKG